MKKRLLSLLLSLCLMLSLLPFGASAAEHAVLHRTYLNPAYAGSITEQDLVQPKPRLRAASAAEQTPEEAAVTLREALKNRAETINVSIRIPERDDAVAQTVYDLAVAHTGVPTEGDSLLWEVGGWDMSGSLTHDSAGWVYNLTYTVTHYTTAEQEQTLTAQVEQALDSMALDGKGREETVRTIYAYVCDHVTYDYDNLDDANYMLKYTAYAALVNGTAVCQGYAILLYRFLLEAGIDCRVISGKVGTENHGWNIVQMGDLWYYMDSTWDAGETEHAYELRGAPAFAERVLDEEYTTAEFRAAYPISETDFVPGSLPEVVASGMCGENVSWTLDNQGLLTVSGEGDMYDYVKYYSDSTAPSYSAPFYPIRDNIREAKIQDGVTGIGEGFFAHCSNMQQVQIPDSVNRIGKLAFFCSGITSVVLPSGITVIESGVFEGCRKMLSVTLPSGVSSIGSDAFFVCNRLKEIAIPESVASIGKGAFSSCVSLTDVYYAGSNAQWNRIAVGENNEELLDAELHCAKGPVITQQPQDASGVVGSVLRFTVAAEGEGLSYQWQLSKDGGKTWTASSSRTASATCTLTSASRDGWIYRCVVTDGEGNSVTTETAKVIVLPAITAQPKDASGKLDDVLKFTVGASGKGLTYQWELSKDGGKTWTKSSSTSATATCTLSSASRSGWLYRCIVTDANGVTVTSDTAKVLVLADGVTITQQPKDASGTVGKVLKFTVAASGDGLTYQWQYSKDGGKTWLASSSRTTTATCTLSSASRDGWLYRCIVKDQSGNAVTTETARVIVLPAITAQPQDASGRLGDVLKFTVSATGRGLTYQWQYSKDGGKTWQASSSRTTTATCTLTTASRDGWLYRCRITDAHGTVLTTNTASVTVIH